MTVLADIVQQAYREGNFVPVGKDPSAAEQTEGLKRLQALVASVLGNEAGEKLNPLPLGNNNIVAPLGWPAFVPPPQTWWLPFNVRVVCNLTGPQSLNLNVQPQDGTRFAIQDESRNFATNNVTLVGNGRLIEGQPSITLDADGFNGEWFYRADLGDWTRVSPLTAADEMPYPVEFDDMFILLLAMRLFPRNAQKMQGESGAMLERSREQFRARYKQTIATPADPALLRLSKQNYRNSWWWMGPYTPSWQFQSGWPWR